MTAPFPRPATVLPPPTSLPATACPENLRLRQDYIDRLAEFNRAAGLHQVVRRAGLAGAASGQSWHKLLDGCASSREAWSRYRRHVADHRCKRA